MTHPKPRLHGFFALAAALLAFAACTDRNPAGLPEAEPEPVLPPSAAVLKCTADVRAGTLACRSDGANPAPGVSATILGGQGTYVRLASSGTSYDGEGLFRSDVTVENLTSQALGTADGVTPSPEGVRVFFHSGPTVTDGSGTVAVENPDGEAFFTASEQAYFQYGGILEPGDTTAAKEWRFTVPNTVDAFTFTVYVAAAVHSEAGWVSLSPIAPSLTEGETMQMTPVVRTVTGRALAGEAVVWTTSNPAVATVDSAGVITAVSRGRATLTATSAGRTGSVTVQVTPPWYPGPSPTVRWIELPRSVTANGADSLRVRMAVNFHGESFIFNSVTLVAPNGTQRLQCGTFSLESGTAQDGVFRCAVLVPNQWRGGVWRVEEVLVYGGWDGRQVTPAELVAAGAPARLQVHSPNEDATAPVLHAFAFAPDSITAGGQVGLSVKTTDVGLGTSSFSATLRNPASGQATGCATGTRFVHADTVAFSCQLPFPAYMRGGEWVVTAVRVSDLNGNFTLLDSAALRVAGYPTVVKVHSPDPDTVPPSITDFGFSEDTVPPNGIPMTTVTMTALDEYSGIGRLEVRLLNPATGETKQCADSPSGFPNGPSSHTMQCTLAFTPAEAGTWRVDYIRAIDRASNVLLARTADLQAAGAPTELVVTPP